MCSYQIEPQKQNKVVWKLNQESAKDCAIWEQLQIIFVIQFF